MRCFGNKGFVDAWLQQRNTNAQRADLGTELQKPQREAGTTNAQNLSAIVWRAR